MSIITQLAMYDLPAMRPAVDAWWAGLARHLRRVGLEDVPAVLTRDGEMEEVARSPDLLLMQTCGYPLLYRIGDAVRLLATPVYAAEGCDGPRYCSRLIVRADDPSPDLEAFRGRRVAYNDSHSQSGCNALKALVAPLAEGGRFFGAAVASGGHVLSAEAVRDGRADIAALDCVTWALMQRHEPDRCRGLRILGDTPAAPALPYVTRRFADEETLRRLRAALSAAAADPGLADTRAELLLDGFEFLDIEAYGVIREMRETAEGLGYPVLA